MKPIAAAVPNTRSAGDGDGKKKGLAALVGPGLLTGASDDDPSGIGTYSQVGAQFGTGMLWTMVFSYPLMVAAQLICARIGRVTGKGLAGNLREHYPRWALYPLVLLLLVANTINIGADLGAMGAAVRLLLPGEAGWYTVAFGLLSVVLEVMVPYHRYVHVLKWLTLALFAYLAIGFFVKIPWGQVLHDTFLPKLSFDKAAVTAIVAIFGTTISPYLFFWQASQEVEDLDACDEDKPLLEAPHQATEQLHRIGVDTYLGMGASNVVAFFIILTTAATLHAHGVHDIESAAQTAQALKPVAGQFASALFAMGIVGTGLLAVPVLAGSAAYAVGETMQWKSSLESKPGKARGFYAVIAVATLVGTAMNFVHVNPIKALFWTAVINGVIAVPMLAAVMLVAAKQKAMGRFAISGTLRTMGWITTAVMAACVVGMAVTA
ncbi:NRAMP family divalent metal transporter [Scleromatobacter humisilvae]|uniref:Divalent metal cation transporter n=1 Tax=Scleromatobacter humisilvae TaxID=2897159 RepID=A0A9X1YHE4_9BURK|nr:divalent metal cation transporter [Scleromatobacter humisilvae]MCK9686153.1 divalent metal cation transporter [Scleromatobacter humisilvae]